MRCPAWTRRTALALCLAIAAAACDRAEPDRNTAPPIVATASAPAAASPSATTSSVQPVESARRTARCIVPLATTPPPRAERAPNCPKAPSNDLPLPHGWVRFPGAAGAPRVEVEIATTDEQRARGLMYRTELNEDSGMLFRWPREAYRSFWMRNTCLPLDMLFIAQDGTIVGILEQVPTLNEIPRRVPCPAAYVLEVNAGWSRAHGVEPGQSVEIDA